MSLLWHNHDETETFFDLLQHAKVGMLTTGASNHTALKSRPMSLLEVDRAGKTVRMFARLSSLTGMDLARDNRANISVMDSVDESFVSLFGTVEINQDPNLIHRLWKPIHLAWYPDGPNDSELAVLEFKIEGGDYWDAPGNSIARTFGMAKAILTRSTCDLGEHGHMGVQ